MDEGSRGSLLALLERHCQGPGRAVLLDAAAGLLLDLPSGKTLPLKLSDLEQVEPATDRHSGRPYLRLSYSDGTQRALTEAQSVLGEFTLVPLAVCCRLSKSAQIWRH